MTTRAYEQWLQEPSELYSPEQVEEAREELDELREKCMDAKCALEEARKELTRFPEDGDEDEREELAARVDDLIYELSSLSADFFDQRETVNEMEANMAWRL